ncbi:MAG: T9SS type A sorting domain-containing protein [Bacteroidia bacterium]
MKKSFPVTLLFLFAKLLIGQTIESTVASRVLYLNSTGITDTSDEKYTPLSEGSVGVYAAGMDHTTSFEGAFYQAYYGGNKIRFRKSNDGINWSVPVLIDDTSISGGQPQHATISVWRSGSQIKVGIAYSYFNIPNPQTKFVVSNDGGNTFENPVFLSTHNDNNNIHLWGLATKGDTLLAAWARQYAGDRWDQSWFSRSLDGGQTWSPMAVAYSGNHYSFVGDCAIDEQGNFYVLVADDQFFKVNLVVARSSDLGETWSLTPSQVTNQGSGNTNTNAQLQIDGTQLMVSFTHSASTLDQVNYAYSNDFGSTWTTNVISDTTDLHVSGLGGGTLLYCHTALAKSLSGRLYAAWADSREFNTSDYQQCHYNTYLSWSDDNGSTWSPNYKVSLGSNYNQVINVYTDLTVLSGPSGDTVLVSWSKNRDVSAIEIFGCTDPTSCTYNPEANVNDNSCVYPGGPCDDGNPLTDNDLYSEECFCAGLLGFENRTEQSLIVYPNPTSGWISLSYKDLHQANVIEVIDLTGRVLLRVGASQGPINLDLSTFENGMYTLRISNTLGITTRLVQLIH